MKLMIVESPNKTKKIQSALGAGWEVVASVGHVRDLPTKEMAVDLQTFEPTYQLTERGAQVISRLKSLVSRADEVFLATDPDREGEAISWHLLQLLRPRSYKRVTFDAITPAVIKKALTTPRKINDNLVLAYKARRVLDRLVGYQVSPVLSDQTTVRGLSAGRVQSPAVRLVVEREREIQAFRETKHFGAEVSFDQESWRATWETAPHLAADEKYILDEGLATKAAACRRFRVHSSETKTVPQAPPAPYTTSTLLQAASVSLGYKPDLTSQLAQKLFEQGLITYHRTDSQNFSDESLSEIRAFAQRHDFPIPSQARRWKAKDSAQGAHEAIRPTHLELRAAGEDAAQRALYSLIWNRAVASQLADAMFSVNTVKLESLDSDQTFLFKAVGRTLLSPGWKSLTAKDAAEEEEPGSGDEETPNGGSVPSLAGGSAVTAESGRVLKKQTRPPARYTQASLIKKLESLGIGRPSTYRSILETITGKNYAVEDRKYLLPTSHGELLVDSLVSHFAFVEYKFTRDLEERLDDIAAGTAGYLDVVRAAANQLTTELSRLSLQKQPQFSPVTTKAASNGTSAKLAEIITCPKCKSGQVRKVKDFYGCSRFREGCNFAINEKVSGKKLTENQVKQLCHKGKTDVLKGFMTKDKRPFEAALLLDTTTFKVIFPPRSSGTTTKTP